MTRNPCLKELQPGKNNMNTGLTVSDGEDFIMVPAELQCKGGAFTLAETGFLIKILSISVT